jgi:septal ring factor EnvC (AmiA/AmiB activator)
VTVGALTSRQDELQREFAKTMRERDVTVGALTSRQDELQRELAKTMRERDETRYDLDNALSQLAELRRSRLLKIGLLLRRIAGLPIPY